ncbi:MAG: hypothetical protein OXU75_00065 [Deltaproteobacteria bacterium]|nr:hypothetical protein [Deltaproteobacteria bacterium]
MGNRTSHGRRAGWMAILDPEAWVRALLVTAVGVASMSALACAVALAWDTTGHDWYATGKLTLTELLTGLGFDDRAPVEYRTRAGQLVTLTRDGLMYNGEALLARDHMLQTAAKATRFGAWCGLGSALLCLALFRHAMEELRFRGATSGTEHLRHPEARARFAPPAVRPELLAPPLSAGSPPVRAPESRSSVSQASRSTGKDSKARDVGNPPASADSRQPDASAPPPQVRRKRQYGRWI